MTEIWYGDFTDEKFNRVWTAVSPQGLVAVSMYDDEAKFIAEVTKLTGETPVYDLGKVAEPNRQLAEYFAGQRREFDLPIDWSVMPPFQSEALKLVYAVPYGRLTTYGDIAKQLGKPGASRAVGRANATNPMPIVIPCHRVLGSDRKLHGYGGPGGLETKAWLLRLEGSWLI
ncbi:MAG: methylated-DNA--[protein]-cysteine S-methyltransferase [Anaerolineae bacterium]